MHPGEILREEFMVPLGLSINALARALHVPPNHVSGIVNQQRGISAQMALRLSRYWGTTNEFWFRLQMSFELETAKDLFETKLKQEVLPRAS